MKSTKRGIQAGPKTKPISDCELRCVVVLLPITLPTTLGAWSGHVTHYNIFGAPIIAGMAEPKVVKFLYT